MKYKVPFFDYPKIYTDYRGAIDDAMRAVLYGGRFILQEEVEEFENNLAKWLGVSYVVGVNSGTDALMLSLIAAGIKPGDEVITVSHTFIATIQVIHHVGAVPVLVDIGADGLMDMEQVQQAITLRTKAIIPVHLTGDMADMKRLVEIVKKSGQHIEIIEDAAQALGARRDGFRAGLTGSTGCFSFYPAKVLGTFGDAGAVVTGRKDIADKIYSLRNHSLISKEPQKDTQYVFGWNSRLDNVWAAVLTAKLKLLKNDLMQREAIADYYYVYLKDTPLILPPMREGRIWQDYVIRTRTKELRDDLVRHLEKWGIGTLGADLTPNHLYPGLGLEHFVLPVTVRYTDTQIRIPCNQFMKMADAAYVVRSIRKFYGM